ncbi:MAG: alpha/beta fold hydrolase [Burkholderiales bacterium]|nr:alpha/beta fold hydrolase [Burkholderiales bacterium]
MSAARPPVDHWIPHADGRLFAREWPAASADDDLPPLVLLHDSLGSVELWRDFPALLARDTGRRVIAYDRAGFGQSDARAARPSLEFIVEEATTWFPLVRRHLRIDRFAALGHSVGGGMAVNIAARHPDSCAALVTIAAQAFVEDRTLAGLREARLTFAAPRALERLARYHGDKAAWVLSAWLDTWLDPAFAHWSLARVLPGVRCRVLALHGELDEYGSSAHPALIARLAGGPARMELLAGLGHVPQRERPGEIARRVAIFMAGA